MLFRSFFYNSVFFRPVPVIDDGRCFPALKHRLFTSDHQLLESHLGTHLVITLGIQLWEGLHMYVLLIDMHIALSCTVELIKLTAAARHNRMEGAGLIKNWL